MAVGREKPIEVANAADLKKFIMDCRKKMLQGQVGWEENAAILEKLLAENAPYERNVARAKAKRVANHFRRVAEHFRGGAVALSRASKSFDKEFAELINPRQKSKKTFDWRG